MKLAMWNNFKTIFILIVWFLSGLFFLVSGYYEFKENKKTSIWPITQGVIINKNTTVLPADKGKFTASFSLTYEYVVADKKYYSSVIKKNNGISDVLSTSRGLTGDDANVYNKGDKVTIHYNPINCKDS